MGRRGAIEVLGIDVPHALLAQWRHWLAPEVQPFFVHRTRGVDAFPRDLAPELRDTYRVWKLDRRRLGVVWLTEDHFRSLPRSERARLVRSQALVGRGAVPSVRAWSDVLDPAELRQQADAHRFVWWPSLVDPDGLVLRRVVEANRSVCRRRQVDRATWLASADLLPRAKELAGTFAAGSGPNCFGTVMAAAGVVGADESWVLQAPFERWLTTRCRPGGDDERPGTVLLWRDDECTAQHAAVTIGDGWALEKPSQEWSSPRQVAPVDELIRHTRTPGWHLSRHRLTS